MIASNLSPFLAPAAGTFALLLLLCVTIGAVLTLTPFSENEKLAAPENDTQSIAWSGFPGTTGNGIEAEDSTVAHQQLAKHASPESRDGFTRKAHSGEATSRGNSASSKQEFLSLAKHTPESDADSQPTVRWWGINE